METNKSNSFLKIMDFESFQQFCMFRKRRECTNPDNSYKSCDRANKKTMVSCPIWKLFKDFDQRPTYAEEEDYEEVGTKGKSFKADDSW